MFSSYLIEEKFFSKYLSTAIFYATFLFHLGHGLRVLKIYTLVQTILIKILKVS